MGDRHRTGRGWRKGGGGGGGGKQVNKLTLNRLHTPDARRRAERVVRGALNGSEFVVLKDGVWMSARRQQSPTLTVLPRLGLVVLLLAGNLATHALEHSSCKLATDTVTEDLPPRDLERLRRSSASAAAALFFFMLQRNRVVTSK